MSNENPLGAGWDDDGCASDAPLGQWVSQETRRRRKAERPASARDQDDSE